MVLMEHILLFLGDNDYQFEAAIAIINNGAIIPDGVYSTALGVFGQNEEDTYELYGYPIGNMKNAKIDSASNTLIVECWVWGRG